MDSLAAQIIVGSVVIGAIYGIVALGFVVLYRSTGVVNFGQGAFMVFGALIFDALVTGPKLGLYPALICATLATAALGLFTYGVFFSRISYGDHVLMSVGSVGIAILYEMIMYIVWGPQVRELPALLSFHNLGGVAVSPEQIFAVGVCFVVAVVILVGLKFTRLGVRMRATADGRMLASYIGIRIGSMAGLAWVLAAATAACGGIVYATANGLDPVAIPSLGILIFPALILGGVDSIGGAMVGGLLLGVANTVVDVYLGGQWQNAIGYLLLLLVLLVRPRGLFGSPEVSRL